MSLGENIRKYREKNKLTQEKLADKLEVSFQAVSSWERDEYRPDTDNLIKLAEVLDVSVSSLVEEKHKPFKTKEVIYNWEHMKTYVKTTTRHLELNETFKAVDFATEAHQGQTRKKSDIPYIYHPLNMACHALAMGIYEDEIIAGILLHDVVEDCGKTLKELPVNRDTKEIVRLMTREEYDEENRDEVLDEYYHDLGQNAKAALVKCIDRCNNLTNLALAFSRDKMFRYITETERYYPDLIAVIKGVPEYNDAAWLLKYQMESMLDIYKRLL